MVPSLADHTVVRAGTGGSAGEKGRTGGNPETMALIPRD
jgi:hypothetical protein